MHLVRLKPLDVRISSVTQGRKAQLGGFFDDGLLILARW